MPKYFKTIVTLAAVGIIAAIIYFSLGGGQTLKFELTSGDMTIYGKTFEGKYDDPIGKQLFEEVKSRVQSNPNETLVVVNYNFDNPDSVKQFIGFISNQSYDLPNIEIKEVTFVKTEIKSHVLVLPNPHDVRESAAAFASDNGLKLDSFSIELYHAERDLEVLFPCKAN